MRILSSAGKYTNAAGYPLCWKRGSVSFRNMAFELVKNLICENCIDVNIGDRILTSLATLPVGQGRQT